MKNRNVTVVDKNNNVVAIVCDDDTIITASDYDVKLNVGERGPIYMDSDGRWHA